MGLLRTRTSTRRTMFGLVVLGYFLDKIISVFRLGLEILGVGGAKDDIGEFERWGNQLVEFFTVVDLATAQGWLMGIGLVGFVAVESIPYLRRKWESFVGDELEFLWGKEFPCAQLDIMEDEDRDYHFRHFYRVGVLNNSGKTIRGIKVRLEGMYPLEDLNLQSDPFLPTPLRPMNKATETVDLLEEETDYWDVAKFFEDEAKDKFSDIFLCCFHEDKRHYKARGFYKAVLAVYSEDTGRLEKEFCLGVTDYNFLVFMSWEDWLKNEDQIRSGKDWHVANT